MRVVFCPHEMPSFRRALEGQPTNATALVAAGIASRLVEQGHTLTYLAPDESGATVCTVDPRLDTPAPRSWSRSLWFRGLASATWRAQRALGVPYLNVFTNLALYDACLRSLPGHDLVFERHTLYRDGIARASARLGLPRVLFVEADEILEHDLMQTPITGLLRRRAARMFRNNLRAADRIVVVSTPLESHLVGAWGVPADRIEVLPNAVDERTFRPDPGARARMRAVLGIDPAAPLVLFVGNFYEWHDVGTVLKAVARVVQSHPAVRLLLVGDGATRLAMEQRAGALGLAHVARFTGLVAHPEVPRYMSAADIAVVPYPVLPHTVWLSPLKLFEAMASGLAVVASAAGQVTQVVQHDQNGLLVPPEDDEAMAQAISRLIDDAPASARIGAQARADAVARHSWDQYIRRLEGVFDEAIAERRKKVG